MIRLIAYYFVISYCLPGQIGISARSPFYIFKHITTKFMCAVRRTVALFATIKGVFLPTILALFTPCKRESGNDKCDYEYVPHNIDLGYKNTNF